MTTRIKTVDLFLAYIGDGYLAAAMTWDDYCGGMEFGYDLKGEDGYCTARAVDVPSDIANDLLKQGLSDQEFSDGYDAAGAAAPYVDQDSCAEPEWNSSDDEDDSDDVCSECGETLDKDCMGEMRCPNCDGPCPHCYDGGGPGADDDDDSDSEPDEPEDEDWVTEDHVTFREQGGRGVIVVPDGQDWRTVVKARMEEEGFYPNVWFISDHGNAHLLNVDDND
jgi:hypothetical protein